MTVIAGMSEQDPNSNGDVEKDFQSTGRTGRRNALADVLGAHKDVSTSDLPLKLEKLSTNGNSTLDIEFLLFSSLKSVHI